MRLLESKVLFYLPMKKIVFLALLLLCCQSFAQSKYTEAVVEKSTDPQVIANFVKFNPNHPRTAEFKAKLYRLVVGDPAEAQPKITTINKNKLGKNLQRSASQGAVSSEKQRTVDLLNHLFSSSSGAKEAYVQIENRSKCNLIVKISGKRFYNLDVPARSQNFILIEKGTYKLTTMVCDSEYSSTKTISKDISIALNN